MYLILGVNASARQRKYTAIDTLREWEQKGQGANWPGSESSRERIGQGPIGRFAPGSELARERKGSVPFVWYHQQVLVEGDQGLGCVLGVGGGC